MGDNSTVGELAVLMKSFISDSTEHRRKMEVNFEQMRNDMAGMKENTIKTYVRVNSLEEKHIDIVKTQEKQGEKLATIEGDKKWILGAFFVVFLLFGVIPYFVSLYIKDSVRNVLAEYNIDVVK